MHFVPDCVSDHNITDSIGLSSTLQGSELAGWALGRYSYEGIDMNHNFADLNSVMWTAIELETDRSKLINHYFPIPEQYTSEDAFVNFCKHIAQNHTFILQFLNISLILIMPPYHLIFASVLCSVFISDYIMVRTFRGQFVGHDNFLTTGCRTVKIQKLSNDEKLKVTAGVGNIWKSC